MNRNGDTGHYERVTREVKTSDSDNWAGPQACGAEQRKGEQGRSKCHWKKVKRYGEQEW